MPSSKSLLNLEFLTIRTKQQQRIVTTIMTMMMIGSFISSIKCVNSFPTLTRTHARNIATIGLHQRAFVSSIAFSNNNNNNLNNLHSDLTTNVNLKSSHNDTSSLFMSTVAAVSAVSATATVGKTTDNNTSCEDNNDNHSTFPEEALYHDTYNGVTIHMSKLPSEYKSSSSSSSSLFASTLEKSLDQWKESGKRGIWIHVPTEYSSVIPSCIELGFDFQHAKNGLLVLTKWLPENQQSRLPHGPTHQLGVGVIIIHPITKKMLVVQEKTGPAAAKKLWKMPTGLLDPGEDIVEAAIREAKEETGLECTFDQILCMRQAHGGIFNQSDMFTVCSCKLSPIYDDVLYNQKDGDIKLIPQEEEIADVKWMDVDEYATQELWTKSPLYQEINSSIYSLVNNMQSKEGDNSKSEDGSDTNDDKKDDTKVGFVAKTLPIGWRDGQQTVYLSNL